MDNFEHKICCDCKRNLPATEEFFDKTSKGKLGLKDICKECQRRRKTLGSGSKRRVTSKYKAKKSLSKEFNDA
ncbi:hypothetical protein [Candidatus Clostridium stratigraminis]|uniref:HNH endonuclease n=1 Tax=Candidatus Clostridium stratigraminis TaxID=3381661 RepID=A0ABW8T8P8_9CLOT